MNRALCWIPVVALVGCMSPAKFENKFESKFCAEWTECNPDWECELGETDYSACDFDRKAAKACLDDEWVCDNSNTALPVLVLPDACSQTYVNCGTATGTATGTPAGTPTDTGT